MLWEWFALLFALIVIPILAHTCWVSTFSCLSWERTVHYMIVLIPTVFLPYVLVSNCYLEMIFYIRIICEKFEFTLHAQSWSFPNITCTLSTWPLQLDLNHLIINFKYSHLTVCNFKLIFIYNFQTKLMQHKLSNWMEHNSKFEDYIYNYISMGRS